MAFFLLRRRQKVLHIFRSLNLERKISGIDHDLEQDLVNLLNDAYDEIERLQKYEKLVQFIANDYHELSHDKAYWQRDDWKKRCKELMGEEE